MIRHTHVTRWITAGLVAATVLSFATAAFADRGGSRRFKGGEGRSQAQRVIIHQHSHSAAPAIAGLIGGFLLGSAVSSNSHPVVVQQRYYHRPVVVYRYYDPYGDDWYDSLDECNFHRSHPRIIQVIDVRSGRHIRTLRYYDGGWNRVSGDYDYRYDDEGDDD